MTEFKPLSADDLPQTGETWACKRGRDLPWLRVFGRRARVVAVGALFVFVARSDGEVVRLDLREFAGDWERRRKG